MAPSQASQRSPAVLVTDARQQRNSSSRSSNLLSRTSSRFITVDNILQHAYDIPSMQQRQPRSARSRGTRPDAGRASDPSLARRMTPQPLPPRSTKVSEKLVLLPETIQEEGDIGEKADFDEDNEGAPTQDDEEFLRSTGLRRGKTYAERLPKARRGKEVPRVTAYCTAQAYKLKQTVEFLKDHHGARTKLYDDCLYVVYHLPLLPGTEGYRIRSSPVLKSPGGKAVLDEEIERNEARDYSEGYFDEDGGETFQVQASEDGSSLAPNTGQRHSSAPEMGAKGADSQSSPSARNIRRPSSPQTVPADALTFAEMFVFSYGVTVFWNFSERQEKDVLADLTFSESETGVPLSLRPQQEEDFETEEFHFEYKPETPRPRMFNDMITLRSGDHMIKLAMSHAIAQSTKLCLFEERMANQMTEAQHIPKRLALTGKLGLKREEVIKILGALFKSRVDVNLSSNVLDVPTFFWDSEPTLHPLYYAVREYLEIRSRIQVLNERCQVFLDLAEILSDSISDNKMSRLTWIIIVLIVLSILVTCSEVFLRFGLLSSHSTKAGLLVASIVK